VPFINDRMRDQNGQPSVEGAGVNRTGTFDAATVMARISRRILGQPAALDAVEHALVLAQAGFQDRQRPLASVLLVGPTGVGKTELVRALAAELRSGPDDLCRVDMGQLAQEHYTASLSGAPPGYAGSRENLSLFDRSQVEGNAFTPGIMLFDEVEKAHPVVLRALLGLLDHGELNLANGQQTLSFRNTLVFLTSNLGSREIARQRSGTWRRMVDRAQRRTGLTTVRSWSQRRIDHREQRILGRAVHDFFEPEFLNRLDEIVHFNEIDSSVAAGIVELRLREAGQRLARRGVHLHVEDGSVQVLTELGFDPVNGARALNRAIRDHVLLAAARALVRHRATAGDGSRLTLSLCPAPARGRSGGPALRVRPPPTPPS
jgi:ATP-dependent Clp protease ATP-binding subunit ClpA